MIHVKDHKTRDMFNPFEYLGTKRLALLESSWAHLFREEILHKLPAEKLFPLYDDLKGRRTKELYTMLGIVLLQQMEDLTDEETVHQFAFSIMWHYALNVTDPSDFSSYVAPRTLWTMRNNVGRLGLEQSLFENVTGALTKLFALDPSKQRLDSVHIFSNMAHLGRIRLFVKTIRKFLVNLKRHHAEVYREHYPFLHVKPFFRDIAVQHRIKGVVVDGAAQSEHGIAVFFQPPSTRALQPHMTDVLVC